MCGGCCGESTSTISTGAGGVRAIDVVTIPGGEETIDPPWLEGVAEEGVLDGDEASNSGFPPSRAILSAGTRGLLGVAESPFGVELPVRGGCARRPPIPIPACCFSFSDICAMPELVRAPGCLAGVPVDWEAVAPCSVMPPLASFTASLPGFDPE